MFLQIYTFSLFDILSLCALCDYMIILGVAEILWVEGSGMQAMVGFLCHGAFLGTDASS